MTARYQPPGTSPQEGLSAQEEALLEHHAEPSVSACKPVSQPQESEGLTGLRFIMVLSSLSPLFALWAIRGTTTIPETTFVPICVALAIVPSMALYMRIHKARKNQETRVITVGPYEDSRKHLLVYLFAILLPLYQTSVTTNRDVVAMALALALVVFLFWHLRLHYINLLFAAYGYQVFTIYPAASDNPYTVTEPFVLVTFRHQLPTGHRIATFRITDTMYMEFRNVH